MTAKSSKVSIFLERNVFRKGCKLFSNLQCFKMLTITCITKMTLYREEPRQGEIDSELIYLNPLIGLHCMDIGLATEKSQTWA